MKPSVFFSAFEPLHEVPQVCDVCHLDPRALSSEFETTGERGETEEQNRFAAVGALQTSWSSVCLQADEIGNRSNWFSVMVTGTYLELREPQYTSQREHAQERLAQYF